ncbi:hypothetical protein SLS53_003065 [Cytospora paraplurivora]|uniref:Uncharacterized protein n=1 Tax=Cytospora paraplurivora TaxID=2898453 RepID=A0AAN9YKD9_9PEZI
MIADVDLHAARTVAEECRTLATNSQFRAEAVFIDLCDEESVRKGFNQTVELFGRMDYCVNCAGLSEFQRFQQINSTGTFLVMREASKIMRAQKLRAISPSGAFPDRGSTRGAIVNLCSAASLAAVTTTLPYTVSKHAQLGVSKSSALDNASYHIRVNSVCPSWVDTPMVQRAVDGIDGLGDYIKSKLPLGRLANPEEIADVVVFALSPRSSFMTGATLVVDGGLLINI